MGERVATVVNDLSDPDICAHLARSPSPQFYDALKLAIQQNSRAWMQRQMVLSLKLQLYSRKQYVAMT